MVEGFGTGIIGSHFQEDCCASHLRQCLDKELASEPFSLEFLLTAMETIRPSGGSLPCRRACGTKLGCTQASQFPGGKVSKGTQASFDDASQALPRCGRAWLRICSIPQPRSSWSTATRPRRLAENKLEPDTSPLLPGAFGLCGEVEGCAVGKGIDVNHDLPSILELARYNPHFVLTLYSGISTDGYTSVARSRGEVLLKVRSEGPCLQRFDHLRQG